MIINALVHADYSQRGAPIRVAFYDDRIEIENPDILLPGMTIEDMMQGVSKIRNHVIARVFRELNLIEQWGSGVRRIFKEAKEQGLPLPQITEIGMRVRVTVMLPEKIEVPTTKENARSSTEQVAEQVKKLLFCPKKEALGTQKSMSALQLKHRPTFTYEYLQPAIRYGLVEMTQPESPKSPTQRYRLTAKGRNYLQINKDKA